jgi:aminoglycoside 2''-phosphotransferase
VVVAGERLVFRFPRFRAGARRLPALVRLLRAVRPRVGLPTPDPLYAALDRLEPGEAFVGYPLLPGTPLWARRLAEEQGAARLALAEGLAAFLAQLHAVPLTEAAPPGASASSGGAFDPRAPWAGLYARVRARLFPAMRPAARREVAERFEAFLNDAAGAVAIRPALIHGDFGPGNVLATGGAGAPLRLSGVIDFDHAGPGDPAVDLAAAEGFGLEGLWEAYPGATALQERARFYRGTFALQEALYGVEHGDAEAFERSIAPYR